MERPEFLLRWGRPGDLPAAPGARLQLVFHRGAATRTDVEAFAFDDPFGLMAWPAPDRAVVDLPTLDAVADHEEQVVSLVQRWVLV